MDKIQLELQELTKLESDGSLDDTQQSRFDELKAIDSALKAVETKNKKDLESALAQKDHFREKVEKTEADRKALEQKLNEAANQTPKKSLDVEDYIDISASLEGLDQKEKERLAKEHKLTGRPLSEIRKDEDYLLWQSAYRDKAEKERRAMPPSTGQGEADKPKTLVQRLAEAKNLDEKEKILFENGLSKRPRQRPDRVEIRPR